MSKGVTLYYESAIPVALAPYGEQWAATMAPGVTVFGKTPEAAVAKLREEYPEHWREAVECLIHKPKREVAGV